MQVLKISYTTYQLIRRKKYNNIAFFNPVKDADGNWILSIEMLPYMDGYDYEIIDFNPIVDNTSTKMKNEKN